MATDKEASHVAETVTSKASAGTRSTLTLTDKDLLRGCNISILLGGIGWRLRGSAGGIGIASADDEYNKSFPVQTLDIFLSHSWHAWWLLKYLTLLFHFNALPAVICAMLAGLSILIARSLSDIPCSDEIYWNCVELSERTVWEFFHIHFMSLPVGGFTFFVVLLHWHYFRDWFERQCYGKGPHMNGMTSMFLDKVCIHQTDAKRKEEGIKSIGAVLGNTKLVLVAWDKSYFERLWCTFELAAFKYANKDSHIIVVPVMLGGVVASLIFMGAFAETSSAILQTFLRGTAYDIGIGWRKAALYCVFYFPMALVLTNVFRQYGVDLQELDEQLSRFSVRQAKCFCCSNDHKIPGTGQVLGCDRELVNASIAYWHGQGNGEQNMETGLDNFDELIRRDLRKDIERTLGGLSQMPYGFAVTIGLWDGLAWMDWSACSKGPPMARVLICVNATFLLVPLTLAMIVWITRLLVSGRRTPRNPTVEAIRNRFIELTLAIFATGVTYLLRRIAAKTCIRLDWLTALWISLELLAVTILYHQGLGYFIMSGGLTESGHFKGWKHHHHHSRSSVGTTKGGTTARYSAGRTEAVPLNGAGQVVEMATMQSSSSPPRFSTAGAGMDSKSKAW